MKPFHYILVIVIALISGAVGASFTRHNAGGIEKKETVSERVMRTRTLRCAYTVFPPLFNKDLNSGKMSGIVYDIVEEIGKQQSLKIEWTAEVAPAGMFEGLTSNQYDAICVGYSRNPARATKADFTTSMFYLPSSIYVRADDNRFDKDSSLLNSDQYRFTTVDGEANSFLIRNSFPKAKSLSLSEGAISDIATRMLTVSTKKSDATIIDDIAGNEFIKANPGKVKALFPAINTYTSTILLPQNEYPLKAMLDVAIESLHESGFIKRSILKHSDGHGFYMPADPFKPEKLHD